MSTDDRMTCRCVVCSVNLPYDQRFNICPVCGEETKPLRLTTPTTIDDDIMTWTEAMAWLEEHDIDPVQGRWVRRRIPINLQSEVTKLHADLEKWAHTAPVWLKR